MNEDISRDLIKRILSLEMEGGGVMDIRLLATILKFYGWANRIVTLTSESKKLDYNFLSVLTYGYVRRYYHKSSNFNLTRHNRVQSHHEVNVYELDQRMIGL